MLSDIQEIPVIQLGDFTLQLELDEPSAELQEVAKRELRETPERQKESVKQLKELLTGTNTTTLLLKYIESHNFFSTAETDLKVPLGKDMWMIRFLRPCKYYPESARDLVNRIVCFCNFFLIFQFNRSKGIMPSK